MEQGESIPSTQSTETNERQPDLPLFGPYSLKDLWELLSKAEAKGYMAGVKAGRQELVNRLDKMQKESADTGPFQRRIISLILELRREKPYGEEEE